MRGASTGAEADPRAEWIVNDVPNLGKASFLTGVQAAESFCRAAHHSGSFGLIRDQPMPWYDGLAASNAMTNAVTADESAMVAGQSG